MNITRRAAFGTALAMPVLATPALAQAWQPTRPLRLIVTYPPGGVNDIVGRIIADSLGRELGQPVIIENRAGAGGNIGTVAAAQAEPDGYTILFGTTAMFGVNPILYASSGVDAARDFVSLGTVGEVANVLSVVPERVRATNLQDFIREAKSRPLVYGSVGNGSSSHLSATVFLRMAGIEATHVPYRGSSPLVAAMLAKEVDFGFDTTATSTAQIRSGSLRPLAVTTTRRASALPDVPTMIEGGLAGYDLGIWFNLGVVKRTPEPIVARLTEALSKARDEQTAQRLRTAFVEPFIVPAAENQSFVAQSAARWQDIARQARIAID
ncbi:tripartite tricarboxylate transporter substrate binding protein [Roseococcus sp. SYP-B2431]|uniref:Bug family tripartite tricarboxylate transporter substrate binding protein n=1 Tax=Roseococcus sp. SYP-B2431 TaxID=2496640 RepID=UPI00103BEE35|nr:tripartite tricarboxylate transporter substrate binding protein [Roseococcus sp. SYP-B2431]TCH99060.1 tripartite tricarboxylate transporter substrate binding protein [Roseococcus sp. SYP-B2431]